jgi:hypothetical protein
MGRRRSHAMPSAVDHWRQSEARWRDPKVPKEMWARRDEQLRQIQADISRVEGLLGQ